MGSSPVLVCGLLAWLVSAGPAASLQPQVAAEVGRLVGHRLSIAADGAGYVIDDIAGEGKPLVGVVVRRGDALHLEVGDVSYLLAGPLAKPRMAGPGYKIWVLGRVEGAPTSPILHARRLGVLAPPARAAH